MRAVNKLDGEHISGGKIPIVNLPPVTVSPSPPPSGTGGGGIGLWGGGLGGPTPSPPPSGIGIGVGGGGCGAANYCPPPVSEQEAQNLLETIAEEIEAGTLGTGTIADAVNIVKLEEASGTVAQTVIENGERDYHWYSLGYGHIPASNSYYNKIINWSDVDWSEYDDGGKDTFMQAFTNAIADKH